MRLARALSLHGFKPHFNPHSNPHWPPLARHARGQTIALRANRPRLQNNEPSEPLLLPALLRGRAVGFPADGEAKRASPPPPSIRTSRLPSPSSISSRWPAATCATDRTVRPSPSRTS